MTQFAFDNPPGRVVFGAGSLATLHEEIERLGLKRALLISTPGRNAWLDSVGASLGQSFAGKFERAMPHVPQDVADQAKAAAESTGADCLVALGGGSARTRRARTRSRALPQAWQASGVLRMAARTKPC